MRVVEFFKEIGISGFFDIAFMSLLIYLVLIWFKRTKAAFVLIGIIIIGVVYLLARQFDLVLTTSVLHGFFAVILIALIIIFQEELRQFFEQVAVWSLNPNLKRQKSISSPPKEVEILVRTLTGLAREKIGALIVIRGRDILVRYLDGGVDLNGELSEPLLKSIFDPHSIGHDGAVVIEKGQITKFSCHLPLSKNFEQLHYSGTRHAAALGLAELTDALCLIVSEERGTISVAQNGEIRQVGSEQLNLLLEKFYQEISPSSKTTFWHDFFKKNYLEKVIAVAMAIALWFVFVQESKLVYKSFSIPVEYSPLPHNYKVTKIDPKEVKVAFFGSRRGFYFLSEKEIKLILKIQNDREGTRSVTISESDLSFPEGISLENIEPRKVKVQIEKETNQ